MVEPSLEIIDSVTLLDSSDLKEGEDGTIIHDWGINTYATYIVDFADTEASSTTTPVSSGGENIFQKMWRQLISLLS